MRLFAGVCTASALMMLGLACNTVSPDQCWPNTSGGLGGAEMSPIGAGVDATTGGDYLVPPRRPLDSGGEPNPCIVQESPCVQKCLDNYESAAIACGKITDEAQSHACSEGARAVYKSCDASCREDQEAQESKCRNRCAEQAELCEAECRKLPEDAIDDRRRCWVGCNDARAACINKCKND